MDECAYTIKHQPSHPLYGRKKPKGEFSSRIQNAVISPPARGNLAISDARAAFLCRDEYLRRSGYRVTEEAVCCLPEANTIFVRSKEMASLFGLESSNDIDYSRWLSVVGGVLSVNQLQNMEMNGKTIDLDKYTNLKAIRPPKYGRAAVLSTLDFPHLNIPLSEGDGLLDVKGCGIAEGRIPSTELKNSNGLLLLDEAIREFLLFYILDGLPGQQNIKPFKVLEYLGVVDLGIRVKIPDLPAIPVCTLIRAPHFRDPENNDRPLTRSKMLSRKVEIEKYLQRYGISSSTDGYKIWRDGESIRLKHDKTTYDLSKEELEKFISKRNLKLPYEAGTINVQLCDCLEWSDESCALVDLSHYHCLDSSMHETSVALARDGENDWGMEMKNASVDAREHAEISHLIGNLKSVASVFNGTTYRWAGKYPRLMNINSMLTAFSIKLTHEYLYKIKSGEELHQEIKSYAEKCLASFVPHF